MSDILVCIFAVLITTAIEFTWTPYYLPEKREADL